MKPSPVHDHSGTDWHAYAAVYDLMAEHNPAYQDLLATYRAFLGSLPLRPGDVLIDVGAGTGNFSLSAASAWPLCRVLHVDATEAMNTRARAKCREHGISNAEIYTADAAAFQVPDDSAAVVTVVHALYTLTAPKEMVERIFRWLQPGGAVFACDAGRPIDVSEWTRYIVGHTLADRGPIAAARLLWGTRSAIRQNRLIARAQDRGTYWRHDAAAFRATFEDAGFEILEAREAYRGVSDLIVAQKPVAVAETVPARDHYREPI